MSQLALVYPNLFTYYTYAFRVQNIFKTNMLISLSLLWNTSVKIYPSFKFQAAQMRLIWFTSDFPSEKLKRKKSYVMLLKTENVINNQ